MKVLFLVPYPSSGPSTRYRIQQYLPYFRKNNIDYKISPFISEELYKIIYSKGMYTKKISHLLKSLRNRLGDILTFVDYDIIFIHLEAFPLGPPLIEQIISVFKKPIIFDLDDAIYILNRTFMNKFVKIFKFPQKVSRVIKLSAHIIVCNDFLKNYAMQFQNEKNITIIHTPIDTDKFFPLQTRKDNKEVVIGWIGSHTTAVYLDLLRGVFAKLAKKYRFVLKIVGAGKEIKFPCVKVINQEWSLERETENFQSLDIGVYPLTNDEWIKGKTGFKTIQYMSVGIPCVVSNIGSNIDIVQDGINGFLASTEEEWAQRLSLLIEDALLRKKLGLAGRRTVEEKYSLKVSAPLFLEVLQKTYAKFKGQDAV